MMLLAAEVVSVDPGIWMGCVSQVIGWVGFISLVVILKNAITLAMSVSISEFLIKHLLDEEKVRRILRWVVNGDQILAALHEIRDKTNDGDEAGKKKTTRRRGGAKAPADGSEG
jgi:hypothetical protein